MNIKEHKFNAQREKNIVKGLAGFGTFVSCDPDANGSLAIWLSGKFHESKRLKDENFLHWLRANMTLHAVGLSRIVAIVETQYIGHNPQGAITMARRTGHIIGALAMCSNTGVETVLVTPASWQAYTAKLLGVQWKVGSMRTKELAARAHQDTCEKVVAGWWGYNEDEKQGALDTYSLGHWWRSLCLARESQCSSR